jgi:serine/threonine protein kinase
MDKTTLAKLHAACNNKKTASNGGLNIPEIKNALIQLYPSEERNILGAASRRELEQICVRLINTKAELHTSPQKIKQRSIGANTVVTISVSKVSPKRDRSNIGVEENFSQYTDEQLIEYLAKHGINHSFMVPPREYLIALAISISKKAPGVSGKVSTQVSPKASQKKIVTLDDIIDHLKSMGYTIGELIGEGASGKVYNAYDRDGTQVIIKFIPTKKKRSVSAEKIIPTYLKQLKGLCRPDITCLLDYVIENGAQYYAFVNKYMEGQPLNKIVMSNLGFMDKLKICLDMAAAIEFMHDNGVSHRDIKPGNTMVNINNANNTITTGIIDMDMACIPENKKNMKDDLALSLVGCDFYGGTPNYIAPELVLGNISPDKTEFIRNLNQFAIDVYSLGITFYYIFHNNKTPFAKCKTTECVLKMKLTTKSIDDIYTENDDLDYLIKDMTMKDPSMRPDIDEVVDRLESIYNDTGNLSETETDTSHGNTQTDDSTTIDM